MYLELLGGVPVKTLYHDDENDNHKDDDDNHDDENDKNNDDDHGDLCPCSLKTPSQNSFLIVDFGILCWAFDLISMGASVGSKEWPSCLHAGHFYYIR